MQITIEMARERLHARFGGLLRIGSHPDPDGCDVCVQELRCDLLGLPRSDSPEGRTPTELACQVLNDLSWSSDHARTEGCLSLVVLSEATAAPGWQDRWLAAMIRHECPPVLRVLAARLPDFASELNEFADQCASGARARDLARDLASDLARDFDLALDLARDLALDAMYARIVGYLITAQQDPDARRAAFRALPPSEQADARWQSDPDPIIRAWSLEAAGRILW